MGNRKCPCRDCVAPRRNSRCHSYCEEYIEWCNEENVIKQKEKNERQIDVTLNSYRMDGIEKARKKNNSIKRRFHH